MRRRDLTRSAHLVPLGRRVPCPTPHARGHPLDVDRTGTGVAQRPLACIARVMAPADRARPTSLRTSIVDSRRWQDYRPRPTDIVVIATYPKRGATWMQRIVILLVQDPGAEADHGNFTMDRPALSGLDRVTPWPGSKPRTTARFVKAHLPFDGLTWRATLATHATPSIITSWASRPRLLPIRRRSCASSIAAGDAGSIAWTLPPGTPGSHCASATEPLMSSTTRAIGPARTWKRRLS